MINTIGDYLLKGDTGAGFGTPDGRKLGDSQVLNSTVKREGNYESKGKIFQYENRKEKLNISEDRKSVDDDGDLSDTASNKFDILNSGTKTKD